MTRPPIGTDEVVERVIADVLAKLPCRDFEGIRQGDHELDGLRRREAARAIVEAIAAMPAIDQDGGE